MHSQKLQNQLYFADILSIQLDANDQDKLKQDRIDLIQILDQAVDAKAQALYKVDVNDRTFTVHRNENTSFLTADQIDPSLAPLVNNYMIG